MLLCLLVAVCGGTFVLEQPFQSMLEWTPRFRHLMKVIRVACLIDSSLVACPFEAPWFDFGVNLWN